jgi:hypothetical protein
MRWLRQPKAGGRGGLAPTPAGVDLAGLYGYSDTAKARGRANGGDIRRAYQARSETLFERDRQR